MDLNLFLNSLLHQLYLSFFPEPEQKTRNVIYITLLWLLLLVLYFLGVIPSTPTSCENEHTQKCQCRAKRRRKGGTPRGSRYYHRKKEENRRLNSILKRPLGQHHDTTCLHHCLDPSCEVYNNTVAELSWLPLPEALEDSSSSVSSLASTASVTESSFAQSTASSPDPPGDLIPLPLPEALPPTCSVLLPNPGSSLGNFLSPSPSSQTLPLEPFPSLESKLPLLRSIPQPQNSFSSNLAQCNSHQEIPALQSTNTCFRKDTAAKVIDPGHLFLSPDEHDSEQQSSYPNTKKDHLKQKLIQLFWGLPSLHSESLTSAVPILGDYSSVFIFNSLSNASTGHEAPVLPYFLPPCLLELQPQSLPQALTQSQPLPLSQIQLQAHLQPTLPVLSHGFIPKNKAGGVHFHGPQRELECLTLSQIQHLEWNVLQRKQQRLKDLPSTTQKSREDFCPSAPTSTQCQPSKAHVSISMDPVGFPLNSELQEKFEHHIRKRLIQHRWSLPLGIHKCVSLMRLPNNCSDSCESKSCYDLSWISGSKGQSSQPGSFYEGCSEKVQLEEDEGVDEGQSQESDPKDSFRDSESSSQKEVGSKSEQDLVMTSQSEENSVVSGQSEGPKHQRRILWVHLSKQFQETNDSQLCRTVHHALHTDEETPSLKQDSEIKQRTPPASAGRVYCLNTSQELSFLEPGTQQMLEVHITKLRLGMSWDLPKKVLESMKNFSSRETSAHLLLDSRSSSSTNLLLEVNSKPGGLMPLRGISKSVHREKVGTENSDTVPRSPLPATSLVGKERRPPSQQGTLKPSPSKMKHGPVEEVWTTGDARPTILPVSNIPGKTSQGHFQTATIHSPKLPSRQAGARHEPEEKNINGSDRAGMQLGRKMEKKEPASMSNVTRERAEAEQLYVVQDNAKDIMTTNKLGVSQSMNLNKTTGTTPVMTKVSPPEISDPKSSVLNNPPETSDPKSSDLNKPPEISDLKSSDLNKPPEISDPKSSDLNKQLVDELKSQLEKRENGQTQGQPTDMSHETNQASLPGAQGVFSEDMGASQVLPIPLGEQTVSVEKQQEPRVPELTSRLCPDKNFPPALKKVGPKDSKSQELGGGDVRMVRSQCGRNRVPAQVGFEEVVGSRSPQTLSQCPPDSLFITKMKSFFQRLRPGLIRKKQETPQVKGSPRPPAQSRGPVRSRAAFMGMTGTQKTMSDVGKFRGERLGSRHAGNTTCPQEPLPCAVRLETVQQRKAAQTQVEPVQWPALNPRPPACAQSYCQAAVSAGQSPTSIIYSRNDGRHPQKVRALKDQCLHHRHAQFLPCRGTMTHHPNPTCRPHPAQGPPAALTTAQGTMFRPPYLFLTHKLLV